MKVCGILVAAGAGTRLQAGMNKALTPLGGEPLFLYALRALRPFCDHMILVVREGESGLFEDALRAAHQGPVHLATGGQERRHSVENGLKEVPGDTDIVLIHDAARPFPGPSLIRRVIQGAAAYGAAVPALPVKDTLRRQEAGLTRTLSREGVFQVQTPQGFQRDLILRAYAHSPRSLTDDAGLVELLGETVSLSEGDARNFKITTQEDKKMAEMMVSGASRTGTGFDVHRLVPGRALILGGVVIPHGTGLLGHSDADAALHALCDALLGACALGDIGQHFPDSKEEYRGIPSLKLLEKTRQIMTDSGFCPLQCDLTIVAQKPMLAPHIPAMRKNIAQALGLREEKVSVKATTTEGLGFEGREEGISAQAVAMVRETA